MTGKKEDRLHWNEFFHTEIKNESDRASVILAAAMLEQALEILLRSKLVPIASHNDPLFDGSYAPISTFSAKIDLGYRLALIPGNFARALHLIRKVRNDFAHNVTGCTFDDASVRSRILELTRAVDVVESFPEIRKGYPDGPAGDLQITVSYLLWLLWSLAQKEKQIPPCPDYRPKPSDRESKEE